MPVKCSKPGCPGQGKYALRDGSSGRDRLCCACVPISGRSDLYYIPAASCRYPGCQQRFSIGKYCGYHAPEGMSNTSNKKCNNTAPETGIRCNKAANFGPLGGLAVACEAHKEADMHNLNRLHRGVGVKRKATD